MRRSTVLAVGCALVLLELPVRGVTPNQQSTFRARTDVVSVNVSVKQGRRPVTDLVTTDFRLTDNGVEQTVDALSIHQVPIDVTLVLTGYNVNQFNSAAYSRSLTSASNVRQSLRSMDRLRVVVARADITGKVVSGDELVTEMADVHDRNPSIIDAMYYAIAWPVEPDRRHLVLAFTDGVDRWSTLEPRELIRLAGYSDAVLHVVHWGGPAWDTTWQMLTDLVQRTGGALHRMSDDARDLAAIVDDFRTSYVLRYRPTGIPAPGWHELRVRVTRPGRYDVRARKGYEVRK